MLCLLGLLIILVSCPNTSFLVRCFSLVSFPDPWYSTCTECLGTRPAFHTMPCPIHEFKNEGPFYICCWSLHPPHLLFFPVAPSRQFTPVYVCSRTPNQPECVIKFNQPYAISSMRFVVMYKMVFTMLHSSEGFVALYPVLHLHMHNYVDTNYITD